ncbi:sensor histidine kinase [Thalassotalea marina]|uniref:histidine kinase n=1 Tax=Thalassotalea marina TaxID=1673741 RepID=A0A919BHN8_9GAMM|nr:HAMP domain-containing sensor histidine kinase [Thalassotalea marina]GHF92273.1 hypothetical protein GCM10017161_20460 [Thalassotalea marina]
MSLRGYLFYLIGGLIVLLTLVQLALVYWIENTVAKEVDVKARQYSKQIVELAVDNLNQSHATQYAFKQVAPNNTPVTVREQRVVKSPDGNVQIFTFEQKNIDGEPQVSATVRSQVKQNDNQTKVDKSELKKEFKAIVDKLHQERTPQIIKEDSQLKTFVLQSPNIKNHWFTQSFSTSQGQSLFQKIQLMLIGVGLIGIGFAFWLSAKFNKPLKQLTAGFEQVAKGSFDQPVPEQGIKEIRKTIFHFNQMVTRLNQLTEAEKHHKEIAHLAELGEVSRGLAHALRNPIHTIGLSLEQLSDNDLSEEAKQQLLSTVQNKISHLDKSIKALLTLTSNGVQRDDKIPILAVVQDIILEYKASVNKQLAFEVNIDSKLKITGAESEIRSILHTLINNACEACEHQGTVKIDAKETEQGIEFTVLDNGKGLDDSIAKQLFQPHVSTKPDGAGMGLYIANRLITLHYHGHITITNNNDTGCLAKASFGAIK